VVEPALLGNVDDFGGGLSQQRNRFEQSHLHPERSHAESEKLVKEAIQVTSAATETVGKVANRKIENICHGKLFKNLGQVFIHRHKSAPVILGALEFLPKDSANHA
jgi:hypothetical protein